MTTQTAEPLRFERLPSVCKRVGVAKSTLYRWIDSEHFPAPIKIGEHTVAWDSRTVDRWMLQLIEDSEAETDRAA